MGMPNSSLHAAQIKQARPLELSNDQMEHEITCEHDVPDMADARSITYVRTPDAPAGPGMPGCVSESIQ